MTATGSVRVRLAPRAKRTELAGWKGDLLLARVAAPPVEGKANEALRRLLADALNVPLRDVRIVSGLTSREKRIEVRGLDSAGLRARLNAAIP
jgi:uncharacterized protein (TIGR00251 family)